MLRSVVLFGSLCWLTSTAGFATVSTESAWYVLDQCRALEDQVAKAEQAGVSCEDAPLCPDALQYCTKPVLNRFVEAKQIESAIKELNDVVSAELKRRQEELQRLKMERLRQLRGDVGMQGKLHSIFGGPLAVVPDERLLADSTVRQFLEQEDPQLFAQIDANFKDQLLLARQVDDASVRSTQGTGPLPVSVSPNWQTKIIEGITALIIKRAKAEALAGFLVKLQNEVCTAADGVQCTEPQAAARLFPATCAIINGTDPERLPTLGSTWRAAFADDLDHFVDRANTTCLKHKNPDAYAVVFAAYRLVDRLQQGTDPYVAMGTVRDELKKECGDGDWQQVNVCNGIFTTLALARSLQDYKVRTIAEGDVEGATRFGLSMALQAGPWDAGQLASLRPDLDKKVKRLAQVHDAVHALIAERDALSREYGNRNVTNAERFAAYLRAGTRVLENAQGLWPETVPPTLAWARRIADVQEAVNARNYGRVVVLVVAMLKDPDLQQEIKLPKQFMTVATLAADVAAAKDAASVTAAFEAAATPVGGYRLKRGKDHHLLSVNAYFGVAAGYEMLDRHDVSGSNGKIASVFVPVGVEYAAGFGEKDYQTSLGVFLSAIDVGALASYRLKSGDRVDTDPEIGFEQVFAPGAYLTWGPWKEHPWTIGLGGGLSPHLRRVTAETVETTANAWRVQVFFAVDLPLFTF